MGGIPAISLSCLNKHSEIKIICTQKIYGSCYENIESRLHFSFVRKCGSECHGFCHLSCPAFCKTILCAHHNLMPNMYLTATCYVSCICLYLLELN